MGSLAGQTAIVTRAWSEASRAIALEWAKLA